MAASAELIRRHISAINERSASEFDATVSESLVVHLGQVSLPLGRAGYVMAIKSLWRAVPDLAVEVHDLVEGGDRVVIRYTERGTHSGEPYFGIPPTGRSYAKSGMTLYRLVDGRIQEGWLQEDDLGVLRQLGVIDA